MKLFVTSAAALLAVASASGAQCSDSPTAGEKFVDSNPLDVSNKRTADECCSHCADTDECQAWTYEVAGLMRSARCYLHSSATLPTSAKAHFSCATHKPAPKPSPSPAAPPSPAGAGTNWVVIAAGSKTYGNYRHQADACHAYQVVRKGGVPAENIILMMEDDVANNDENPFKGKLFNKPTAKGTEGYDVYDGCNIDYRGSIVTAKLFTDVLTGNSDAVADLGGSGKVLKSGPNDKVFINFVDHGGTGIIEFPNGDFLHATDLNTALKTMHTQNMYKKLVFYMEACESGSMFKGLLPTDINVFATTAANAQESSWGTYCPPDDSVNGRELNSCLGDLYSVNWMEDADKATGLARTLENQYEYIVQVTNKSHPQEFGTLSFSKTDTVGDYLAPKTAAADDEAEEESATQERRVVDTHDIELVQDFYKYLRAETQGKTAEQKQALADQLVSLIQTRQAADAKFANLGDVVNSFDAEFEADGQVDADCVKAAYNAFRDTCGAFDSYTLKYSHQVADLCLTYSSDTIQKILNTVCVE